MQFFAMRRETAKDPLDEGGDTPDDFHRQLYCVLGIPVDAIGMRACLRRIEIAIVRRERFLISTPNLNFLVNSLFDSEFRESLFMSDLCPADGTPIVWIARLLGIPIRDRIAGSDIFDALQVGQDPENPLKVFLFGGSDGVAAAASRTLNESAAGICCVGSLCPGFGSIESMSSDDIIDKINLSDADVLVVALGAKKGQSWLQKNHYRLRIPVRAHLGAVLNFQAGKIRRAPFFMRSHGLEWLWRILEEPYLWRRYWIDGKVLLRLLATRVLPIAIRTKWLGFMSRLYRQELFITQVEDQETLTVILSGAVTTPYADAIIHAFRRALEARKKVFIDCSKVHNFDARCLGLLLILRKKLKEIGESLVLLGLSPELARVFNRNGLRGAFCLDEK